MVVFGTGGMSHQLDGERAGFINKDFDLLCLEQLVKTPEALTRYTISQLVELAGSQGVRVVELDRDARRADRPRLEGAQQLSHSDFQHGLGVAGAG